eukprot:scaffold128_cov328-Pavlova_lutheri.AAC.43
MKAPGAFSCLKRMDSTDAASSGGYPSASMDAIVSTSSPDANRNKYSAPVLSRMRLDSPTDALEACVLPTLRGKEHLPPKKHLELLQALPRRVPPCKTRIAFGHDVQVQAHWRQAWRTGPSPWSTELPSTLKLRQNGWMRL